MFDLYLISTFDSIVGGCIVLTVLGIVALATIIVCSALNANLDPEDRYDSGEIRVNNFLIKTARPILYAGIVAFVLSIFVPSSKQGYIIYGLGNTIEYVKNNDKAKMLPDKAIEALGRYLDEVGNSKDTE